MPEPGFFKQLGLFVVPNFVGAECGAELCRQMAAAPAEKATVISATGEQRVDEDAPKVDASILADEVRAPFKQRLRDLIPEVGKYFGLQLADCESPQYLIYRPGDFFKPHLDSVASEGARHRLVSIVVFLNGESQEPAEGTYSGGQLTFYRLLKGPQWENCALPLQAEPGLLIAFPSDLWHEVKPVSHGQRFTVVSWFLGTRPPAVVEGGAG